MRITLALLRRSMYRKPLEPPQIEVAELTKKFANLPEKYIEHVQKGVYYRTPRGIGYLPRELKLEKNYVGLHRIWSLESQKEMKESKYTPWVEPLREWFILKGDRVQVLTGKDKGKQGIVDMVIQERNWVIVKGLNTELVPSKDDDGTIFTYNAEERPLLVPTQVALVDPGDLQPTEVEWAYTEEGDKVRVSKRSGRIIPISRRTEETYQYKSKATYIENDKDTRAEDMKSTFQPKLMTFEMDVAEELGIQDDRIPKNTYWY